MLKAPDDIFFQTVKKENSKTAAKCEKANIKQSLIKSRFKPELEKILIEMINYCDIFDLEPEKHYDQELVCKPFADIDLDDVLEFNTIFATYPDTKSIELPNFRIVKSE